MDKYLRWLGVVVACFALGACAVMNSRTVDTTQLRQLLKSGDVVEVGTVSGQQLRFTIEGADAQGLYGGGQYIAYTDIRSVTLVSIPAPTGAMNAALTTLIKGLYVYQDDQGESARPSR